MTAFHDATPRRVCGRSINSSPGVGERQGGFFHRKIRRQRIPRTSSQPHWIFSRSFAFLRMGKDRKRHRGPASRRFRHTSRMNNAMAAAKRVRHRGNVRGTGGTEGAACAGRRRLRRLAQRPADDQFPKSAELRPAEPRGRPTRRRVGREGGGRPASTASEDQQRVAVFGGQHHPGAGLRPRLDVAQQRRQAIEVQSDHRRARMDRVRKERRLGHAQLAGDARLQGEDFRQRTASSQKY